MAGLMDRKRVLGVAGGLLGLLVIVRGLLWQGETDDGTGPSSAAVPTTDTRTPAGKSADAIATGPLPPLTEWGESELLRAVRSEGYAVSISLRREDEALRLRAAASKGKGDCTVHYTRFVGTFEPGDVAEEKREQTAEKAIAVAVRNTVLGVHCPDIPEAAGLLGALVRAGGGSTG
jgi:hypothetical protein